ncbi:MAG: hypothetical protein AAF846_13915 [Chloroflexota bacterium]
MKKLILIISVLLSFSVTLYAQNAVPLQCGSIVESEFTRDDEIQRYTLALDAGDQLTVSVEPFGDTLTLGVAILGTDGTVIARNPEGFSNTIFVEENPIAETGTLSASGNYELLAFNNRLFLPSLEISDNLNYRGGRGLYTIFVTCTLRDGTIVEAGDFLPINMSSPSSQPAFSGFGVPPMDAVDFSNGIELPLTLGQPAQAPIGGGLVALYTVDASAGQINILSVARLADDFPVGVAVINQANNDIIFFGGMPFSNDLTVTLTFPEAGTYVIGLFALDGTSSGAVQITLE